MPSQTFQLARPDTPDPLPQYSREPKLPGYLQLQDGTGAMSEKYSTVCGQSQKTHTGIVMDAQEGARAANFAEEDKATEIPQALLVDAATSLCAYLYFTTLQAQLVLQQQASLDLLSTLCSSLADGSDVTMLHTCAHAISHQADSAASVASSFSHRYSILLVAVKAICGYLLLTRAARSVRPFDYLVASGTLHCLVLYLVFFMPVASLVPIANVSEGSLWARITFKMICLLGICCFIAFFQWVFQLARTQFAHPSSAKEGPLRRKPAICLP